VAGLDPSDRAPGLVVGADVELADDVELGPNVVIHDGVTVEAGCRIETGAVLGKVPRLGPQSSAPRERPPRLLVAEGASIGTGAIVFAGVRIGPRAIVGDRAFVRERAQIGAEASIGYGCVIAHDARIGERARLQTHVLLTAYAVVEDDVFMGPNTTTTNDDAMGRGEFEPRPPVFRRGCRIGGGSIITPGVEIGEDAFVAAGAVVTRDVPPRTMVMGVPARVVREI
jgi:acetyltransferase-like isoleucine patch superfamily enzyme